METTGFRRFRQVGVDMLFFEEDEKNDPTRRWSRKESVNDGSYDEGEISTKILLKKIREVAPDRSLGGSEIVKENGINIHKTILIFCDTCGDKLDEENIVICRLDGTKVCVGCAIKIDERKICARCLRVKKPLSKDDFRVLVLCGKGLKRRQIQKLTRIPIEEIRKSARYLLDQGYLSKKLLRGFAISADGKDIVRAYSQIYRDYPQNDSQGDSW